jgi:hypothetical protein
MDLFEKLPVELIQDIIAYTANFVGVESLLTTSPRVRAVFQVQPRTIVSNLIPSNPIKTMPEIQRLCRNISLIKSPTTQPTDIHEYRRMCDNISISGILAEDITTAEIYHLLHTAARIQRLACQCLCTMQQNLIAAVEPSCTEAAGKPFIWLEEYRVYWALWHLQHYSDLRNAAIHRWKWPPVSLRSLGEYSTIWMDAVSSVLSEDFWTVAAVLAGLGFGPPYYGPRISPYNDSCLDDEEAEWAAWQYSDLTPMPYFATMDPHLDWQNYPVWSPPPPPPADDDTVPNDQRLRSRCESTVAMRLYRLYSGTLSRHGQGRAYWGMMRFRPYRRLGVVFWSSCRMYEVGLLCGKASSCAQFSAGDRVEQVQISQHGL